MFGPIVVLLCCLVNLSTQVVLWDEWKVGFAVKTETQINHCVIKHGGAQLGKYVIGDYEIKHRSHVTKAIKVEFECYNAKDVKVADSTTYDNVGKNCLRVDDSAMMKARTESEEFTGSCLSYIDGDTVHYRFLHKREPEAERCLLVSNIVCAPIDQVQVGEDGKVPQHGCSLKDVLVTAENPNLNLPKGIPKTGTGVDEIFNQYSTPMNLTLATEIGISAKATKMLYEKLSHRFSGELTHNFDGVGTMMAKSWEEQFQKWTLSEVSQMENIHQTLLLTVPEAEYFEAYAEAGQSLAIYKSVLDCGGDDVINMITSKVVCEGDGCGECNTSSKVGFLSSLGLVIMYLLVQ